MFEGKTPPLPPQLNVWLNTSYAKAQAEGKGGTIRPPTTLMVASPIKEDDRNILQRLWNGLFDVTTGYEATDHARYIAEVAKRAGVDPRTLMAIIMQESGTRQRWPGGIPPDDHQRPGPQRDVDWHRRDATGRLRQNRGGAS